MFAVININKDFIHEFSEFLADKTTDKLLICGDFNVPVCCPADQFTTDFKSLLTIFNLIPILGTPWTLLFLSGSRYSYII